MLVTMDTSLSPMLQVKLRGMRVELGEIESALVDAPGVQLAAVLVLKDSAGAQRLVAYVTPALVDTTAVLASVKSRLPAHMVPNVVILLAVMPLSPSGKVDRKALPEPAWGSVATEEYVAPVSELEVQLQTIFQNVLSQERVSTQADFFTVGGTSLQVSSELRTANAMLLYVLKGSQDALVLQACGLGRAFSENAVFVLCRLPRRWCK